MWGDEYKLLTSAPSDWSGDYVIVSELSQSASTFIADGSVTGNNFSKASSVKALTTAGITYDDTNKKLTGVTDANVLHITPSANSGKYYITLKGANSTIYLIANSTTGSSSISSATSTTYAEWTLGMGTSGNAYLVGKSERYVGWNSSYFRAYDASNKDNYIAYLFKKIPSAPIFSVNGGSFNATFTLTITGPDSSTLKYTTDGSDPSSSNTATTINNNTTEVNISATTRVRAIVILGGINSTETDATYTYVDASIPSAVISETTLDFSEVAVGGTPTRTFTITPYNLTGNLTVAITKGEYTVSPASIAQGASGAQTITVTAIPTAIDDDMDGTVTISGGGITTQTVGLSATLYQSANATLSATDSKGTFKQGEDVVTSISSRVGSSATVKAVPVDGFTFLNWSAVGATPASSTNAEEEFTFTSATPTLTANFVREAVAPMAVTSAYTLVTDAATLVAGDKLLIVSSKEDGTAKTLSATEKTNNRDEVDVVVSDEAITSVNAAMQIINLEGSADEWYFNVGTDKYLYAGSSGSNYMYTGSKSTAGNNGKAKITIANGIATIKFQGSNTRNWIQYNSGSKLFSCYSSAQKDVYLYRLTTPDSYDVTIGSTGWRTLVSSENVSLPDGVKAYIVTATDGDEATLTEVASVKANTPVLLNGPDGSCTLTIIDTPAEPTGNLLEISTANVSDNGCYVLAERNEKVGFYLWEGGSLGAGRVILPASAVSGVREFIGIGGGSDGINMVQVEGLKVQDYYDLSGRRVVKPTKGLYIVNGKKIMVK